MSQAFHEFETIVSKALDISTSDSSQLLTKTKRIDYQAGDVILDQGMDAKSLIVILEGVVGLKRYDSEGCERFIGIVGQGQLLFEDVLWGNQTQTSCSTALDNVSIIVIPIEVAKKLHRESIEFANAVSKSLLNKCLLSNSINAMNCEPDMLRRVVSMVRLIAYYCKLDVIPMSMAQLGDILGMSRNRVSQALKYWNDKDEISMKRGKIFLNNGYEVNSASDRDIDWEYTVLFQNLA
ncbi:hypothetical protein JCM19235_2129 [Vibrio maritimus]|uniref:Cyclic nucleotide-binding domain-containing protein n=1 Tax=Vibrio maritimus TaxID=990268 RepID=A0A090RTT6_9VIBR|nr:hypothetical protein JCM19235_2129 [Vibrio maritimus]